MTHFDVIIGGGGFAGSSLAISLAGHGLRVLIVEPQLVYADRVRGEGMAPWGVAEAAELGVDSILLASCAREVRKHREMWGGGIVATRALEEATPHGRGYLCFPHVQMQETLINAAAAAGAQVLRGGTITGLQRGRPLTVSVSRADQESTYTADLIVAADGRTSRIATLADFHHQHGRPGNCTSGVMLEGLWGPRDAMQHIVAPGHGVGAITFPVTDDGLTRAYTVSRRTPETRFMRGVEAMPQFIAASVAAGMSPTSFTAAKAVGPLSTYDGTHMWVDEPYEDGVALIGDAASTSDPAWGNGLSLAARDVRELRDAILGEIDFNAAGRRYAAAHAGYYSAVRRLEGWYNELIYETGEEADERRSKAVPCHRADRTRIPDMIGLGPNAPNDRLAGLRFLGDA